MTQAEDDLVGSALRARLSRRRVLGGLAGGAAVTLLAGAGAASDARAAAQAAVGDSVVAAGPQNVLSAVVSVSGATGKTVRVEYGSDGKFGERTPEFPVTGGDMDVPVLGLLANTDYQFRAVATGDDGKPATGAALKLRTAPLPEIVPAFEVRSPGKPEPGFTLLAPIANPGNWFLPSMVIIVDESGRVVWYRETQTGVLDFQPQPNGHYTAAVGQPGPLPLIPTSVIEEWDVLGNMVASWTVQNRPVTDWHEARLVANGDDALLLGLLAETRDTRPFGGPENGQVWGHVLQRLTRAGEVTFEWNAFDHFKLDEADEFVWTDPNSPRGHYDWTHPNAVELDHDGNYLVSSRHFSEVTKIDAKSGNVIWRMGGGKGNQFKFIDDPHNGFSMQHAIRRLPNGHLILFDNGNDHKPPTSRAAEYEVDEKAKTARLVWSYEPGIFGFAMGNAERLPGGNTLISFGASWEVVEVTPQGEVVWQAKVPPRAWGAPAWSRVPPANEGGFFGVYRAFRIPSLYEWAS